MNELILQIRSTPEAIDFQSVIAAIDENYDFVPTSFSNGETFNEAGKNSGSCKLFAFAKEQGLSISETLACFGNYYKDVLKTPEGTDHQNIRNFMKFGWAGISFEGIALSRKK